jgi:hypothetical protein
MGALTEKWRELGHDVGFGIGIAHGYATLGTIGFEGRFDYAAIGTVSRQTKMHQRLLAVGGGGRCPSRVQSRQGGASCRSSNVRNAPVSDGRPEKGGLS